MEKIKQLKVKKIDYDAIIKLQNSKNKIKGKTVPIHEIISDIVKLKKNLEYSNVRIIKSKRKVNK